MSNGSSISTTSARPKQIALLLPKQGDLVSAGQAVRDGYLAAYYDQAKNSTQPIIKEYDVSSGADVMAIYQRATAEGADFIIGPLDKKGVQTLNNSGKTTITTLALNYSDLNQSTVSHLYEFGLSPQDEANQVATKAAQDNHRNALMIVPAGNWGNSVATALQQRFQSEGGRIVTTVTYSAGQDLPQQIKQALQYTETRTNTRLNATPDNGKWHHSKVQGSRRQDIDVVLMSATPAIARQVRPLLKFYYAGDIPIYATSQVYAGTPNPSADRDLNDIKFCDIPWVLDQSAGLGAVKQEIANRWPNNYQRNLRLYALGVDAYRLTNDLPGLASQPGTTLTGATGQLYLDDKQHVLRRLPWAQFKGGVPQSIS